SGFRCSWVEVKTSEPTSALTESSCREPRIASRAVTRRFVLYTISLLGIPAWACRGGRWPACGGLAGETMPAGSRRDRQSDGCRFTGLYAMQLVGLADIREQDRFLAEPTSVQRERPRADPEDVGAFGGQLQCRTVGPLIGDDVEVGVGEVPEVFDAHTV